MPTWRIISVSNPPFYKPWSSAIWKGNNKKLRNHLGHLEQHLLQHVQRAASIVKQPLLQSSFDEGKLAEAFDLIKTCPEEFCSRKWTEERFLTALRSAGIDNARELRRDLNVKTNEALSKEKARAIISSGDDGVVRHLFDAGLLAKVLFENPVYEKRSIKHASMQELGRRAGEMMRCYDFIASMDFGVFDGSCTSEVRSILENDFIVSMFSKLLDTENDSGLLYTMRFTIASRTRRKASVGDAHMHGSEKKIVSVIGDWQLRITWDDPAQRFWSPGPILGSFGLTFLRLLWTCHSISPWRVGIYDLIGSMWLWYIYHT